MEKENWISDLDETAFDEGKVAKLADRPNSNMTYGGVGGLSAKGLKEWFDKSSVLIKDKLVEIIAKLNDEDALAKIQVTVKDDEGNDVNMSAKEWVEKLHTFTFIDANGTEISVSSKDFVEKLARSLSKSNEDIADLQQGAFYLREIYKSIIDDVPSLHLHDEDSLSVVLEKAQEYWNDQEPQIVVSGTTLFRLLDDDGSIKPVERDIPPFTRVSFNIGGNVTRGTAYMPDRIVRFEVVGEIADNTIKIINDVTLEDVDQRSKDNAQEISELMRNAVRSVSFEMLNDAANKKEYVLRVSLKNADGNETSYAEVDLPLEMAFVDAKLNEDGTKILFELQNGKTVELPTEALMRWKEALKEYQKKPTDGTHFVLSTEYASKDTAGIVKVDPENGLQCDDGNLKLSFFSVVDGVLCLNFEEEI